jgi:hypothetical protein
MGVAWGVRAVVVFSYSDAPSSLREGVELEVVAAIWSLAGVAGDLDQASDAIARRRAQLRCAARPRGR